MILDMIQVGTVGTRANISDEVGISILISIYSRLFCIHDDILISAYCRCIISSHTYMLI